MVRKLQVDNPLFWNILRYLESIQCKAPLKAICEELSIDKEQIFQGIKYLQNLDYKFYIDDNQEGGPWVIPPNNEVKIPVQFSLTEWLALQAHFPLLQKWSERPFNETLLNKLSQVETLHPQYDLWVGEWGWPKVDAQKMKQLTQLTVFLQDIHMAILHHHLMTVTDQVGNELVIAPLQLIDLDDEQILLAENFLTKELKHLSIAELNCLNVDLETRFTSSIAPKEVESYFKKLLEESQKQLRIILKILSYPKFNLHPINYEVKNPYITTNGDGEMIWAGTISLGPLFYEWLWKMGSDVEILSPGPVREKYEGYCKEKLQKGRGIG